MGAGSGWVFFSGARVIAPTVLSLFESLVGRVVLALLLCRQEGGGRVYARRAAVLCSGECTPRDGLSHAQKEGRRAWCVPATPEWCWALGEPCRAKVGKFEGKCSGPSFIDKTKIGTLTMVDYDFFG